MNGRGHEEAHGVRPGNGLELGPPSAQQTKHLKVVTNEKGEAVGEVVTIIC